MRKFLLFAIATMMSVAMMAAGGDGSSESKAIYFDWENGHEHVGTKWYRVDLAQINGMVDPTLALYLTNLTDESVKVNVEEVSATISVSLPGGFGFSKDTTMSGGEYTIGARDYKLWSQNVKMLLELNVRYLHLKLNAEQKIMLSAKKYETSEIVDLACEDAVDFDWSGVQVEAGEKWYRLNLAAVKAQNKKLNFVVANQGSADATVAFDLSLDCPASVVFGYNWTIPAGGEMTEEFGRVFIDELKEDYVYLKLNTNQALNLSVEEVPAPAPKDETWAVADVLTEGQAYTFSGEHIFEVPMATLSAPRGMKAEFVITNNTGVDAVLTKQISFANPVKTTIDKELAVAANATVTKEVVNNMAGVINSQTAYIRFNATQELTVQLNYVVVNEEVMNAKPVEVATCEKSQLLDWNSTIMQSGLETKWYEVDLSTIKQNDEHLQLTFTNKSNNIAVVMGEILYACEGDTLPYICPVPAGMSVSQVINYNLFALVPHPTHFYISATVLPTTATSIMEFKDVRTREDLMKFVPKDLNAIQEAEVELTANTISALVDPTACNQATTIASGVKYEQAAGTTKWYRVTDELLNKLSLIPDVAFINNGKQAANITLAASVDCEHSTFGMSTFSLPTWADMTVFPIRLLGDLLDKKLNQDVTEMYLQVTTDQPIAFGIDIDYGFGLGCDDARPFNWETGATIKKGDAQWLDFDIASAKKNKQQVRLTLTNESNSLAWVAMMTSLTCPFDVALPMVFAIPAGMSIDKVVDYSYFAATKLDQLYVALITEETISVKAVAEKSQASASDYAACENAVEVKNGEAYVQKAGTSWYKFDRSLFSDVSRLPKFRYAAEATTSLTMGVTVGCEYNIATRGTIKLPSTKGLEVSFRMPGFIYDVLDKFVHDDVQAVYVEMTTDQQIKFGIDMEYAGGCEKATKLDLSQPLDVDLTANKDVWYYLDLMDVRAMGDEKISFRLNNQSDKAVEVEFEVTPTCPLVVSAIKSVDVPAGVDLPLMVRASMITDLYDQVVAKFDIPDKIANNLPSQLQEDLIYYVRVRANGDLSIEEGDSIPEHVEPGCEVATPLDITKEIDVDKLQKGWYVVDLTTIKTDFSLKFVNNSGSNQTVDFQFYKGCDQDEEKMLDNYLTSYNLVVPTTGIEQKVPYSLISSYLTIDELYIYVNKTEGGEVDMACASALLIDLNNPFMIELEEGKEQWFKIAPKDYENFDKNLVISTKNLSGKSVKVDFSLATACPALVTVDSTITVNSDLNRVDSITAGMIKLAWEKYGDKVDGIDTAYIRVLANGNLQLAVDTFTVVIPEMPEGCENAKELDWTKTINLSEIQTGWYHVDLTPLKNGQVKSVSINNDLGEETGVKFDIFRSCEENSFLYTYTHAFKVGMFNQSIPAAAVSMLGSINELYIYITVGVDVLTCEDAIEFDWNKGAVHQAGSTHWYHFDINPIKANNQQVKLTFTNHSSELAVMYGEVALHCPYTYSIPYACVVPPGMSIDKVVDYSVFAASRVEELYVKVYSNETIELGATTESAEVFDNAPCDNAPTVQSGVKYTQQAGTSWYRLPKSLFKKTGMLPKFYFTTEEEGLTKITLGATVGCDHNIATKTIFMLPGSLNYAMVVHEKIFDAWDKLINDEVTEVYVELTTDKEVSFSVDMINDTDDPCHAAELLDVTKGINLEANVEKWYKIDLDALKAMKSDVAVKLINPSASAVTLDMEFSPTCPVVVSLNKSLSLPALPEISKIISQETIAKIPGVSFYVRFEATADVQITFSEPEVPEYQEGCEDAILLDWTKTIDLASLDNGWYKLNISSLRESKKDFSLSLNNNTGDVKKLTFDFYKGCSEVASELAGMYLTSLNITAPNGITTEKVPYAALNYLLGDDIDEFYIYLTIEGGELNEACMNAILLDDPNVPHTIQLVAGQEQWFKVATNALDKLQYNLKVTVDAEVSDVNVSVSSSCLVDPVIDTTVVLDQARHEEVELAKSTILDKWSKYSSKVSDIDTAYVRVLSTGNITLSTDTVTPTPPADPDDCENGTLLDWTKTVNLSTLTTGWYKFDLSSLHASQSDFQLSLNNDMGETKAVEMTLYLSCDQPYEAKTTQVFPVGITTRQVAYSLLTQVVGTADMVYVYIKTDIQVPVIPEADACLNAIELTWNDTLNINAGDTTWYMLPLAEAKALGKDLELTVSNNSGSVANVYVAVAEQCPVVAFLTERRGSVEPGSITKLLKNSELNSLADTVYFLLSSTEELSISVSVYDPVPPTEPDSCLNGTLLDWTQTVNLSTLTTGWYKFDLSSLHASQSDFTLSLNNDMGETKAVEMTLYLSCDQPYEAKTTQVFPVGITTRQVAYSLLTQVVGTADMVYVYIKTDIQVPVIPEADACLNAIELTWNDTLNINAGDTTWYMLPLAEAKALGKDLTLTVINSNDADANVYVAVAETCPVLAYLTERTGTVPANMTISRTLSNSELTSLADTVYFRLSSTRDLTIVANVAVEEPEQPQGCEDAILLDWTKTINLSDLKTGWYKFDISSIHTANTDFTLSLNNDLGEAKNLGFRLYKDCDSPMMGETVMTFPVGITSRTIPANLLSLVDGIDMLYVYLTIDAPLPCEGAILFDWNKGAYQEASKTQWYEFDITPVLDQEKQVKLTFTNHSNENAWVIAELAFHCPYTKSIPIIVPVPANMSVDKWIDYSAFEASRIEHFYLGITTREAAIELDATWEDARIAPSEGCLNATLVENEVLYEHAAGTHWYKFIGDLFEDEGSFSRLHVINRSAKTVNITAGGTVGCEYNIATRTSFKLPRRFDLAFAIPVWVVEQMKKFVDDDVTEFYLELTTDQPIAFSFGMDACEEAIPFDWTTGHTQEALTTQWYDVNIAPVLANEQQIKLTFTNHSDQTAWVGTLVSLNCPFKVALPLAFPIPAGMSVDKVIDYSYFAATRLDQLYVGVTTDSKISVKAEAQSAIAHPNDKAACATAKTLKVDENNIHPAGTSWYKVDGSLFANMERLPKFRFETVSGETTTVTVGATVGCDYNIATRGTVKMPGGLDMYLRAPRFIFSVIEKFIDDDVNEFYVELTTDKDVEFTIFADHDEDLTACSSATDFVLSDSMTINLEADKDVWYRLDMAALKAANQDWSVAVVNASSEAVNVEVEVSPTCPMVASAMKEFTVPASVNVATVITAEQIAAYIAKFPNLIYYVRVRATEDLTIEVTEPEVIEDTEACLDAKEYILGTDITLDGDSDVWYKLDVKELRDKAENIVLTVINNATDTAKVTLDLYDSCPVEYPIASMRDIVVDPLQTIVRTVSYDILPTDVDVIYLHVQATGSLTVNLSTTEQPFVVAHDTIVSYLCHDELPVILTWNDTVHVSTKLDSVYTYVVNELAAPVALSQTELADVLGTLPELTPGTTPDLSATISAIQDYFTAKDDETIADVVSLAWNVTPVACNATSDTITLVVEDECGNQITADYVFAVATTAVTTIEETVTICTQELPYTWQGMQYTAEGTHSTTLTNQYGCDSVVYTLHLNVLPIIPETNIYDTICAGEYYTWNLSQMTYDSTGVYTVTMASQAGCDSIVNLHLTVMPEMTTEHTYVSICNGTTYTWDVNGTTYRRSYVDSALISSQFGCDSVLHYLHLTVLPATKTEKEKLTICASQLPYTWRGQTYYGSGDNTTTETTKLIAYDKFANADCDSVKHELTLTVLPKTKEEEQNVLVCAGDSYTWDKDNQTYSYTDAGTYTHTYAIQNVLGCDSIVYTLNLVVSDGLYINPITLCYGQTYSLEVDGTIHTFDKTGTYQLVSGNGCKVTIVLTILNEIPLTTIDTTVCYGQAVEWEHESFTQTGSYTKTLHSVYGCDSVVTLNLTVLPEVVGHTDDVTICYGTTYDWNGNTYNAAGTYTATLQNANGCDSVVTLNLTILPQVKGTLIKDTICFGDSYTWNQGVYNATGTYTAILQDTNGCEYTDTLVLVVRPQVNPTTNLATICDGDSVLWQGQYVSAPGTHSVTLKDINGCDSIVNLELVILPNDKDSVIYKTICDGETYIWDNNQVLTQSGTYVKDLPGCNATLTLHLTVYESAATEFTESACQSYTWNGETYTVSGDFVQEFQTINGCDSIVTLHLTINQPTTSETTAVACGSYEWNGTTYTQSGDYTYITTGKNGCDSIATLHLTIGQPTTSETTVVACESYEWNGSTYTQSGDYTFNTINSNGCDSVATLHLTINRPTTSDTSVVACESYDWNGTTYTQSGDYTYTTTGKNGCDSVATLHLTVYTVIEKTYSETLCEGDSYTWSVNNETYFQAGTYTYFEKHPGSTCDAVRHTLTLSYLANGSQTEEYYSICEGETYDWNGQLLDQPGDYTHVLSGCNASVTLHLTVTPKGSSETTVVACGSYEWNGTTYTQSGDYTFNTKGVNTCDSVATLHLTINQPTTSETTVVACESYEWNGTTYIQSGDYTYTTTGKNGCDSVATLHLTINQPTTSETTVVACESYEWNGSTYTQSGDYTFNTINSNGCDSVATLHLTINRPTTSDTSVVACESYDWNGTTYTQSGDYTYTTTGKNGCDSVATLHLTVYTVIEKTYSESLCEGDSYTWSVNNETYPQAGTYTYIEKHPGSTCAAVRHTLTLSYLANGSQTEEYHSMCEGETYDWNGQLLDQPGDYTHVLSDCNASVTLHLTVTPKGSSETTVVACGSYEWNGTTYTQSGDYTFNTKGVNTCDSVATLHLTINHPTTSETTAVTCESYEWNGTTYTQSGDYTYTTTGKNGCDSVATLHLTINQPTTSETTVVACESYDWNSTTYTQSGDYTYTTTGKNGCDSVATLHLTILPATDYRPTEYVELCYGESYSWKGMDCSAEKVYTYVEKNIAGCDSVVHTLDVKVHPEIPTTIVPMAICYGDSTLWQGKAYYTSGFYSDTLMSANGCDSIVTLHLTVFDEIPTTIVVDTICYGETYKWIDNKEYTTSGSYSYVLPNELTGCDSVVTLQLYVRSEIPPTIENVTISAGETYKWIISGLTYDKTCSDTVTLNDAYGCDSVMILNLTVMPVHQVAVETITAFVCDGTGYVDPISKKEHIISSLVPSTLTWSDTVVVSSTLDSIYNFTITPIVAPAVMTKSVLETIPGALPILKPGMKPVVDGTIDAIMSYYEAIDTEAIADVDTIYWAPNSLSAAVACDDTTFNMTLIVEAGCDNLVPAEMTFEVSPLGMNKVDTAMICFGEQYVWNGKPYGVPGTHTTTLVSSTGCDSIATLLLYVWPDAVIETKDTVLCYGESFVWRGQLCDATQSYVEVLPNILGCDSIIYQMNVTVLPKVVTMTTDTVLCFGESFVWNGIVCDATKSYEYTYKNVYGCDSVIATMNVTVLPDVVTETTDTVLCFGESFVWNGILCDATKSYEYTYKNILGCDSLITTMNVTVLPDVVTETKDTVLCYGESFVWNGLLCDATKSYEYTYKNVYGCDSVIATMNVTVLPDVVTETSDTVLCYGESFVWNGILCDATKSYEYTYKNIYGCDSLIATMNVTVLPDVVTETSDTVLCYGESFVWNGILCDATKSYEYTYKNIYGCDSLIATMNVTVLPDVVTETKDTVLCYGESFVWNGILCDATKSYEYTYKNIYGCDSLIATMNVTVLPDVVTETKDTVLCYGESFVWNGILCDATKSYEYTYKNIYGCDSLITTMNVTVLPDVVTETKDTFLCFGESFVWNGIVCDATKSYEYTYKNVYGCDSVIATINVTVLPDVVTETSDTVLCYGESFVWNGILCDATKSYEYTYKNVYGCDSVIATMNVTVLPDVVTETTDTVLCFGESFVWNGILCDATKSYEYTYKNIYGCDSLIATMNVTVLPDVVTETKDTVLCYGESFVWNGILCDATKSYEYTYKNIYGCDSLITTMNVTVLPDVVTETKDTFLCFGESFVWNGIVCDATKSYEYTYKNVYGCDSVIATINVTVLPDVVTETSDTVLCFGESFVWNGIVCDATKSYEYTYKNVYGCDSVIATINVTVLPDVVTETSDTVLCFGESFVWNGIVCDATKSYEYTYKNVYGCDSVIATMNVTVLPDVVTETSDTVLCFGESFVWNGIVCDATKSYEYTYKNIYGCDSLITIMNVTILPETKTETQTVVVCPSELPYIWFGQSLTTSGTYTAYEQFMGYECDSIVHVLDLNVLLLDTPTSITLPVVVCGQVIDVTTATAELTAHFASENYATNAKIEWLMMSETGWVTLSDEPVHASVEQVTIKYVITTDCGTIESDTYVINVESPNPENDIEMDNIDAVSKYGNRILLLNLNTIREILSITPSPEQVSWYQVVGERDVYGEIGDDQYLGYGLYYNKTDATPLEGQYYALIAFEATNDDGCSGVARTVVLTCEVQDALPILVPNVARPNEALTLKNLDTNLITEILVYTSSGELIATYTAEQAGEFIFNAAHVSGYYMVDVITDNNKVTLRYIVK